MLQLPFDRWTLDAALAERARLSPDAPFVRMIDGEPVSYARMQAQCTALAYALEQEGVKPGDRVVVMGANCLWTLQAWFALNLLGAVDVTINTAYRGHTLEHAINTADARLILIEDRLLPVLRDSEQAVPGLIRALCYQADGAAPAVDLRFERVSLAPLASAVDGPAGWRPAGARMSDLASIIFTSGTSGPAKGVMLPHAQTYLLARESAQQMQVTERDVYYVFHPLFHMSPRYVGIYAALIAGAAVCLDRSFSAADWLDRIRACGATVSIAHGPMLEMIHAQPARPDDADNPLRRFGTSPFPRHIAAEFEARFAVRGLEVWGMTEANIPIWSSLDEPLRPGCCGRPIADHYELRIVDPDTDCDVAIGATGELLVRSKLPWTLMQGYFGMPDATIKAWRNLWFHTGDLVYRDDGGYYHFVDRLGDRIRRRAENISSYEIEHAATTYPGIGECAAVGVASEFASDDDVKLVVVPNSATAAIDPVGLLAHLARRLPHYMVPRYIEIVDALPRTPTNKIRKAELRQNGVGVSTWDRKAAGIVLKDLVDSQRDMCSVSA
ncbi:MAG: AMP-binding protein [Rhodopseudomonas palustris]|uniref:AMP-binding protein n=1 Tax=Rhodopseudomonas palustris TaxID=1076 RepID=A0A933VZC7_RHOPL|nr:AMP-binding protein [Rhodopseudomonas palustris]